MYERVFKPSIVSKRAGIDRRDDGLSLFGRGSIPSAIAKKSVNAGRHWDMMTAVLGFVRYTPGCECECVSVNLCVCVCVCVYIFTYHIHPLIDAVAGYSQCEEIRHLLQSGERRPPFVCLCLRARERERERREACNVNFKDKSVCV